MSAHPRVTSRCDVAHCGREELHHFLPVLLRGMLPLFSMTLFLYHPFIYWLPSFYRLFFTGYRLAAAFYLPTQFFLLTVGHRFRESESGPANKLWGQIHCLSQSGRTCRQTSFASLSNVTACCKHVAQLLSLTLSVTSSVFHSFWWYRLG